MTTATSPMPVTDERVRIALRKPEEIGEGSRLTNYVIQGDAATKELDIYHLVFAPTYACNIRCKHCYLPGHEPELLPRQKALEVLEDWTRIVLEERGRFGGIFHVKGGEPFAVNYLPDLIDAVTDASSLIFMMTTNGTIHGTKRCGFEKLAACNAALDGNMIVNVSLDGASESTHSLLRGPGTYARTLEFIRRMRELDITVHINSVLHQRNLDDITNMVALALHEDVRQVNFLPFVPKGYGFDIWDWAVDPFEIFTRIAICYAQGGPRTRELLAGSYSDYLRLEASGIPTSNECVGGYAGLFYLVPNGDVYSCPNLVDPGLRAGSVHEESLWELHRAVRERVYRKVTGCDGCSARYVCKGEYRLKGTPVHVAARRNRLKEFQDFLMTLSADRVPLDHNLGTSYCFSRNL